MPDLDDTTLQQAEIRAGRAAFQLLKDLFPMSPYPRRDEFGTQRHGYGRPIDLRPMTERTASHALREDIVHAQNVLRGRVFELLALHPEAEGKVPYLYAIGDILGAEQLAAAEGIWTAMRKGDWHALGVELMTCNWERYYGSAPDKRRAVFGLIMEVSAKV